MKVWMVVTTHPVHAPCCNGLYKHAGQERYRTHVEGVWFSRAKAQERCKALKNAHWKPHVVGYTVRDADELHFMGAGI